MISSDNLWKVYEIINGWIKFSDTKAGAALAINGVMIGLINSNLQNNSGYYAKHHMIFVLLLLGILMGGISIYCCLSCLNPTLKTGKPKSLIFFSHISQKFLNYDDYFNAVNESINTEKTLRRDISRQIWANSKVAHKKYVAVTWAIRFLSLALLIDIASLVAVSILEIRT